MNQELPQYDGPEIFALDGYEDPIQNKKAELIAQLHSGDFTLSFSSLSAFAVSPRAFIAYKLKERKETKAMRLGTAVHCLVLEPEKFRERYIVAKTVNGATKEGKAYWAELYQTYVGPAFDKALETQSNAIEPKPLPLWALEYEAGSVSKIGDIQAAIYAATEVTVLDGVSHADALRRTNAVLNNRAARSVLDQLTQTERKITFEFEGLSFRGMVDGDGPGALVDLKNCPDARVDKATRMIQDRNLHWQAFGYNTALGGNNACYIIAVDGIGEVSVHRFSPGNLAQAEQQMADYCQHFKRCILESRFDPNIWDSSQDFWLQSPLNEWGVNYL